MKGIRQQMGFSLRDLSAVTSIKYRTLQDYEGGQRKIPEKVAQRLLAEQVKEQQIKAELIAAQEARLDREFPNGIASAPGEQEPEKRASQTKQRAKFPEKTRKF